jgi:serine/threonine-protein kinase
MQGQGTLGPYELIARIGSGGMANVYRARDSRDGRFVALKIMHDFRAEDPDYLRRFAQEAKLAIRLEHPHIVQVYEAGEANGQHYLAMELVEGETLQDRLQKRRRLRPTEVREIAVAVASALDEAHRQRVVHRDVKPGNVLLGLDGSIKVSDFGIARALDATSQTLTGTFLGSVAYASPEAINGKADPRGDLYSLGCLLYQCLLGHVPFEGATASAVMRMHERDDPPDLERVRATDPELGPIVERLLVKDPDDRYQSAAHLLRALGAGGRRRGGWWGRAAVYALAAAGGAAVIAGGVVGGVLIAQAVSDDGDDPSVTVAGTPTPDSVPTSTPTPRRTPGLGTRTAIAVTASAAAFEKTLVHPLQTVGAAAGQTATVIALTPTTTPVPALTPHLTMVGASHSVGSILNENEAFTVEIDYAVGVAGTIRLRACFVVGFDTPYAVEGTVSVSEGEDSIRLMATVRRSGARLVGYQVTGPASTQDATGTCD